MRVGNYSYRDFLYKRQTLDNDIKISRELQELRAKDRKVRQHEMAHKVVAGQYAGPMSFEYVKGPDGRLYAVAGEVKIDVSEASTPEETIRKMEQVKRAALAPADPSPQDRRVAAEAEAKRRKAEAELRKRMVEEGKSGQFFNLRI